MAAIYHDTLKCMRCDRHPPEGFLYRCTQDRDPLILSAKAKGDRVTFDSIGDAFAEEMTLGKFGPDARRKQHSFLNEITAEQMASYTLEELSTILEQREKVHKVIDDQRRECYKTGKRYPDDTMPWLRREKHECRYVVCHQCHRRGREKSWVSLNGVLNGDILPTVATGFSFSYPGSRPCADANIVRNIGCRAVPLVRIPRRSLSSQTSVVNTKRPRNHSARAPSSMDPRSSTDLTSPVDQIDGPAAIDSVEECSIFGLPLDGRATTQQPENTRADYAAIPRSMPSLGDTAISVHDFILEYEYSEYTLACCTPLPAADVDEDRFLSDLILTTGGIEGGGGHLRTGSADVVDGVALSEEAAESCTADGVVHTAPTSMHMEMSA